MPFGVKPVCSSCKITSSPIWRKGSLGEVLCNSCGLKQSNGLSVGAGAGHKLDSGINSKSNGGGKSASNAGTSTGSAANVNGAPVLRKSARIKPVKKATQSSNKSLSTKGKGRRIIFKKSVSAFTFIMSDIIYGVLI